MEVERRIRQLSRRDRKFALALMRVKPIRLLGGCLECGERSFSARMGIYVPEPGCPVQQVVVYSFCAVHAEAGGRMSGLEIENRLIVAVATRPHIPVVDLPRKAVTP